MVPKFISQASLLPFSAFFTLLFPESCSQCLKGAWRSLLRAWGTLCYAVGCCALLQGIILTQGLNLHLLRQAPSRAVSADGFGAPPAPR